MYRLIEIKIAAGKYTGQEIHCRGLSIFFSVNFTVGLIHIRLYIYILLYVSKY